MLPGLDKVMELGRELLAELQGLRRDLLLLRQELNRRVAESERRV